MAARCISRFAGAVALLAGVNAADADSSSPLLAAYYDRQMAIVGGEVYAWRGDDVPRKLGIKGAQVGVGYRRFYVLTGTGNLLQIRHLGARPQPLAAGIAWFAAGETGVLAIDNDATLWWIAQGGNHRQRLATDVARAAVGDGANYYVTRAGALFVRGKAHRGQYGDGRLRSTPRFVRTATDVAYITAHTGHAILLTKGGDVLGTGGNIYGPVGRHGIGDKAVRWSRILGGVKAIATGSSHSVAILRNGTLVAWGRGYKLDPVAVMKDVKAVAAGSSTTIALRTDGSLWQWGRGNRPRRVLPRRTVP